MNRFGDALKALFLLGTVSKYSVTAFTPVSLHQQRQWTTQRASSSISNTQQNTKTGLFAIPDDLINDSMMTARQARIMSPMAALMAYNLQVPKAFAEEEDDEEILSSKKFKGAVKKYFPGASTSSDVTLRLARALRDRGYNERNTLLGASLCSDEINDTPVSLINALQSKLLETRDGGVFNLGGLGGLPFVGTSGFGAFTSHCPENGKVVIVFGPHVGVSNDGVVGKVERVGKETPSTSCGAAVGAYKAISANKIPPIDSPPGSEDFQEEFIISNLRTRLSNLVELEKSGNDGAVAYVTDQMYDLVWQIMKGEVEAFTTKKGFWDKISEVTLLGGIVINRGHGERLEGGDDLFQPLLLTTVAKNGETNIYQEVFGDLPTPRQHVLSSFNQANIPEAELPPPELLIEKKKAVPPSPVPVTAPAPVAAVPAPAPAVTTTTPPPAPAPVATTLPPAPAPVAASPPPDPVVVATPKPAPVVVATPKPAPVVVATPKPVPVPKVPTPTMTYSTDVTTSTTTKPATPSQQGSILDSLPSGVAPAALGVLGAAVAFSALTGGEKEASVPPAAIPTITNWKRNSDGSVSGFVYGSQYYLDGDDITTSPLTTKAKGDAIVTTSSGSKYVFSFFKICATRNCFDF